MSIHEDLKKHTKHVDRPEIQEVFANHVELMTFDGLNMHLELTVVRYDEPKPPAVPTGRRVTACRLVLPGPTIVALHNNLAKLVAAMQQSGMVKFDEPKGPITVQ